MNLIFFQKKKPKQTRAPSWFANGLHQNKGGQKIYIVHNTIWKRNLLEYLLKKKKVPLLRKKSWISKIVFQASSVLYSIAQL